MCGFSTQQCKKMLLKAMKNICEVHLNMPADRAEGRGALWQSWLLPFAYVLPAQSTMALPLPTMEEQL